MASKTIKGLTVEIGGDTTKLGKALKNIEAESRSLSKELGDINKLLKLDPGNVDLLSQKQKVLAEAAEAAAKKLDTLKEAEKQVQEQFERGEVSEEQLRALQREIVATENKMKGYQNAAKETADAIVDLGKQGKQISLSKEVAQQEAELKKLKTRYADVVAAQGKNSKEAKELEGNIKSLSGELRTNKDRLSDAERAADEAAGEMDDLGSASKEAGNGLSSAASAAGSFIGNLAADAVKGIVEWLGNAVEESREYRTEMSKLDTAFTQSGHSSEAAKSAYSDLVGVLGETDQSVEAANHLAKLTDNEKDLSTWTGDILPGVFATFGDSLPIEGLTEAANETAKVGQVTGPLADALNWAGVSEDKFNESLAKCSSEQERQALITETLAGLYGEASEAYKETNAEVIRANQANDQWMQSLAGVGGAIEPVLTDIKLMGASILSDLVPGVEQMAEAFRGLMNGDAGAADALGEAFSGIITQLLSKITELAPSLVSVAMSLITTLTTTLISMLPQLVSTGVELLLNVVNGLTSAIPQLTAAIVSMIPQLTQALVTGIPQLLQAGVDLLLALVQAIPQILPPLIAALPQIIMALVNGLMTAIPQLLQGALQLLMAIVQAIPLLIEALAPLIPQIVTTVVNGLQQNIPVLLEGALQLLNAIVDAIPLIIEALVPQIPSIVSTLVVGLTECIPTLLEAGVQLFMALVDAIPEIIVALGEAVPDIITGIVEGLMDGVSKIGEAALELGKSLLNGVKSFFGINSPSTVMKEQGGYIVDGMVNGLADMPAEMLDAISGALDVVKDWGANLVNKVKDAASNMLTKMVSTLKDLPGKIMGAINGLISKIATWGNTLATSAKNMATKFLNNVVNYFKQLPGKVASFLTTAISNVTSWASNMASKAKSAATNFLNNVVNTIKSLPSKIWSFLQDAISKVAQFGTNAAAKAKSAAKSILDAVVNGIKSLPSKVLSIGSDLVTGLWNGVNNKLQWLKNKIKSFTSSVLSSIKSFFGVHSPSTETAWIGDMLDQGLAKGVLDNMGAPISAMQELSGGMLDEAEGLNGLTLERQLNHTFTGASAAAQAQTNLLGKLDSILTAIERGQVLLLDGDALVGGTVDRYNNKLGQLRVLAARGAL